MPGIKFYGVRGSIPSPLRPQDLRQKFLNLLGVAKASDLKSQESRDAFVDAHFPYEAGTVGGNSSCVRMLFDSPVHLIGDAGTGLRELGLEIMQDKNASKDVYIFFSHTHWDHIMGFPFFIPAYTPGYNIKILGCHDDMRGRFIYQQTETHFPIRIDQMASKIEFVQLTPGKAFSIGNISVTPFKQDHPGDSYAYAFQQGEKKLIYSTDASYSYIRELQKSKNFFSMADLFVFDAMYSFTDFMDRLDWGHCSSFVGVDFCVREDIKHLVLFHHEPTYDDKALEDLLSKTRKYSARLYPDVKLKISLAIEGETLTV